MLFFLHIYKINPWMLANQLKSINTNPIISTILQLKTLSPTERKLIGKNGTWNKFERKDTGFKSWPNNKLSKSKKINIIIWGKRSILQPMRVTLSKNIKRKLQHRSQSMSTSRCQNQIFRLEHWKEVIKNFIQTSVLMMKIRKESTIHQLVSNK